MDTSGPDTPGAEEEVPVEPPPETAPPEEAEPLSLLPQPASRDRDRAATTAQVKNRFMVQAPFYVVYTIAWSKSSRGETHGSFWTFSPLRTGR